MRGTTNSPPLTQIRALLISSLNIWPAAALLLPLPLAADVLVPGKAGFTRYEQGSALVAFQSKSPERAERVIAQKSTSGRVPRSPVPRAAILSAIEQAGLRYASDRAIAKAGLTSRQWVALFRSNIEIESAYKQHARSHVGAIGLGQLMPATAKALGVNPHDIHQNLDGSARYLLAMLRKFGSKELALAAYNAGPHAVERYGGIPPFKETQGHVRKVVAVFHRKMGS